MDWRAARPSMLSMAQHSMAKSTPTSSLARLFFHRLGVPGRAARRPLPPSRQHQTLPRIRAVRARCLGRVSLLPHERVVRKGQTLKRRWRGVRWPGTPSQRLACASEGSGQHRLHRMQQHTGQRDAQDRNCAGVRYSKVIRAGECLPKAAGTVCTWRALGLVHRVNVVFGGGRPVRSEHVVDCVVVAWAF